MYVLRGCALEYEEQLICLPFARFFSINVSEIYESANLALDTIGGVWI